MLRYSLPGAGFRGGEKLGGTANVKLDCGDYLANLNGALTPAGDVRYGRFSIITDILYVNATSTGSSLQTIDIEGVPRNPISSRLGAAASTDVKGFNLSLAAGYTVAEGSWGHLDLLGGFRWFRAEVDGDYSLNVQFQGPRGNAGPSFGGSGRFSGDENIVNGIVGVRGRLQLGSGFFIPYYLDIGTGDSNFTWQGYAGPWLPDRLGRRDGRLALHLARPGRQVAGAGPLPQRRLPGGELRLLRNAAACSCVRPRSRPRSGLLAASAPLNARRARGGGTRRRSGPRA